MLHFEILVEKIVTGIYLFVLAFDTLSVQKENVNIQEKDMTMVTKYFT